MKMKMAGTVVVAVLLVGLSLRSPAAAPASAPKDAAVSATAGQPVAEGPILILTAINAEELAIRPLLEGPKESRYEGLTITSGVLSGNRTVIARVGCGKVNAAMVATMLVLRFRPTCVLFSGVAGGLAQDVQPGDVLVAEKTLQHDYMIAEESGNTIQATRNPFTGRRNPTYFPADPRLLAAARRAAAQKPEMDPVRVASGLRRVRLRFGTVATGDVFVASAARREEIRKSCNADAVEMEGAAVAQVCAQLDVPLLVIRAVSDTADGNAVKDFDAFCKQAAVNSAKVLQAVVKNLDRQEKGEETSSPATGQSTTAEGKTQ